MRLRLGRRVGRSVWGVLVVLLLDGMGWDDECKRLVE